MSTRDLVLLPFLVLILAVAAALAVRLHHRHPAAPTAPVLLGIPGPDDLGPSMDAGQAQIRGWLAQGDYASIEALTQKAVADYKQGLISDIALRNLFNVFTETDPALEQRYADWQLQFRQSYPAALASGIYFRSAGEERRGDKYIRDTPEENVEGMRGLFGHAFMALQSSLTLDDKPIVSYQYLISVGKHVKDREYLRRVLDASVRVAPKNFIVRRIYLRSLRPRWGGSMPEMEAFLAECRAARLPPAQLSELEALIEEEYGWVAWHNKTYDQAITHYANALRAFPHSNDGLWLDDARLLKDHAGCKSALPAFSHLAARGEQLKTDRIWVLDNRGWCLGTLGRQAEAVDDYRVAAALGDPWAETELGELLYHGGAVTQNREEAQAWFSKAAGQGDERAKKLLAGNHDHK